MFPCQLDLRLCFAKIPCALKIVRFPATIAASSRSSLHPRTPRICPGEPERYTCIRCTLYESRRSNTNLFHDFQKLGCSDRSSTAEPRTREYLPFVSSVGFSHVAHGNCLRT